MRRPTVRYECPFAVLCDLFLPTAAAEPNGTVALFVSDGISDGRVFGAFYRKKTGSLRRLRRRDLPLRTDPHEAELDLRDLAARKGWFIRPVTGDGLRVIGKERNGK